VTRALAAVAAALALAVPAAHTSPAAPASPAAAQKPRFGGSVSRLPQALRERMKGVSWHAGCPVGLSGLRLLTLTHWGFDGQVHTGNLVVRARYATPVLSVFRTLFAARYPVRRMRPVDDYGGSDFASIEADNTSAFNCRNATGSGSWSEHAYGEAIDLNPVENPYVSNGRTSHPASRRYLDRSKRLRGMIHAGDVVVRAFASIGWGWGGSWPGGVRDYQHFSASGH
jgi:hypothetical protein